MKKRNKYEAGSLVVDKTIAGLESKFNLNPRGTATSKSKLNLGKGLSYTREQKRNLVHGQGSYRNILEKTFKGGTKVKVVHDPQMRVSEFQKKPGFIGMEISKPI